MGRCHMSWQGIKRLKKYLIYFFNKINIKKKVKSKFYNKKWSNNKLRNSLILNITIIMNSPLKIIMKMKLKSKNMKISS